MTIGGDGDAFTMYKYFTSVSRQKWCGENGSHGGADGCCGNGSGFGTCGGGNVMTADVGFGVGYGNAVIMLVICPWAPRR